MSQENNTSSIARTIPLLSGLLAGGTSTVLLYPLDLVKVRLQVNESGNSSKHANKRTMIRTLRNVLKHEGFVGIYQGLTPAVIGSAVSWGGYFFFYEGLKIQMIQWKQRAQPGLETEIGTMHGSRKNDVTLTPLDNFAAACASGAIMVGCTNPLWLIKTRMQLQMKRTQEGKLAKLSSNASNASERIKPPYKNIFDAFRTIVKDEGFLALYKGSIPALMLVSHGGIQFMVYEALKKQVGTYTKATRVSKGDNSYQNRSVLERLQDSVGYL